MQYHVKINSSSGKSGSYDLDASIIIGFASSVIHTMLCDAAKLGASLAVIAARPVSTQTDVIQLIQSVNNAQSTSL